MIAPGLFVSGCSKKANKIDRPNIIFISLDTLRADHLGAWGYKKPTSPFIDRLAFEGVRFSQAFSNSSWTLPAHMSMMTSQYPHVHGVETADVALADSTVTLAELLSGQGFKTGGFISWIYVSKHFGFDRGFDNFHELLPPKKLRDTGATHSYRAEKITDAALKWVKKNHKKQFFLFLHYFDPHVNYDPPAPYDRMFDQYYRGNASGQYEWLKTYISGIHKIPEKIKPRDLQYVTALYDGEIRYTDTHIGRLLKGIDSRVGLDNCMVILTSDHGEEFNDHGSMEGHQWTLYDEVLHIPLIIRFPDRDLASSVIEKPVELVDIAPTILDYFHIKKPVGFQGTSLIPIARRQQKQVKPAVFAETMRHTLKVSIRTKRFKLIHTDPMEKGKNGLPVKGGFELYDLINDHTEQRNIFNMKDPLARRLIVKLEEWLGVRPKSKTTEQSRQKVKLSEQDIKRLRSLGYIE